jgi:hypothetical protein
MLFDWKDTANLENTGKLAIVCTYLILQCAGVFHVKSILKDPVTLRRETLFIVLTEESAWPCIQSLNYSHFSKCASTLPHPQSSFDPDFKSPPRSCQSHALLIAPLTPPPSIPHISLCCIMKWCFPKNAQGQNDLFSGIVDYFEVVFNEMVWRKRNTDSLCK